MQLKIGGSDAKSQVNVWMFVKGWMESRVIEIVLSLSFSLDALCLVLKPINCHCCPHVETSLLICCSNQLPGFYMKATTAFNGLNRGKRNGKYPHFVEYFERIRTIAAIGN